jgi:hypothetical protein
VINITINAKIKKLFQDVVFYEFIEKDSKKHITLKTTVEWNKGVASAFQVIILDRNPIAYGGPYNFKNIKEAENLFIVTWNCYNVTD